jgi:hypothetical protein
MKILPLSFVFGLAATALAAADADLVTQVKNAAKKLADQPNYSWTTTSKSEGSGSNFRMGPVEGKTEKGGYTCITGSIGENKFEVAMKGDKFAVKREDTWESGDDLAQENNWMARRFKDYKAPAAEAEDLVAKVKELRKTDDRALAGEMTEAGAKEVFSRWGRRAEPTGAKGSAKFWLNDGVLVKYEYNLQGKITVNNEERDINRTTTVEFKDVGKTKVDVPAEAKKKL